MTKQEARQEKEQLIKEISRRNDCISELDAIINAPETDPRVGKLFWFWGDNESMRFIRPFAKVRNATPLLPYQDDTGGRYKNCRPVTLADLEGKIYQEPRKSRYDWSKAPKWANFAATDKNGYCSWYELDPNFNFESSQWISKSESSFGWTYAHVFNNVGDCPDWRDSLEERPEGV